MQDTPARVREYADQAVAYVRRALGVALEYDSDTLPLLDHYLRSVSTDVGPTLDLVVATAGAYFGEAVIRMLGGRWDTTGETQPASYANDRHSGDVVATWRVVLPTGLNFSPAGFVASAIAQEDVEGVDTNLDAPARMLPYVRQTLERMGEVSVDDYYSLCGRLDTLEHVHEVLVAVAAQMLGNADDPDAELPEDDSAPDPVPDEPSGPVN